jgi:hypothetical protein
MLTCNNSNNDTPDSQNWESPTDEFPPRRWTNEGKVEGYVYLIKPTGHNVYKIGCSVNPTRRLKALQSRVKGVSLEIVTAILYVDYEAAERHWHHRFSSFRLSSEWFALPDAEVQAFLQAGAK